MNDISHPGKDTFFIIRFSDKIGDTQSQTFLLFRDIVQNRCHDHRDLT